MLKGRLTFVVVTVLLTGVWLWLYSNHFLSVLDTRLQDKLLIPRQPWPQIVLVTIDNASIQELGVWPFPRSLHAQLIDQLMADTPKAVGYDVTFSELSSPSEDQALAESIERSGRVVLASEAVLEIKPESLPLATMSLMPLAGLVTDTDYVGPTTLVPDSDGVIREAPITYLGNTATPSKTFALILAEILAGHSLAVPSDLLRIDYVGGPGTFSSVSFADVLRGSVPPGTFTDKIVLVGATAPDLHDEYLTPFGSGRATPGVEVQANIIQSLVEGRSLKTLSLAQTGLVFAVIMLLGLGLGLGLRLRWLSLAALLVFVSYLIVAVALASQGLLLPLVQPLVLIGAIFSIDVLYRYRDEYARRQFIQSAFGRYVAPAVVEKLVNGEAPLELGGLKEELTILFSDIRGFTSLSEKMTPEDLVTFLNEYLTGMTDVVLKHEGTVDKYIGDAVMAFWGAPLSQADHAQRAVAAAVAMRDRLAELNQGWHQAGRPVIAIGIGLNTGRVIVGNMGSQRRFDYTVIGDDVNLASRLESLTKFYGVSILISEATAKQLADRYLLRALDKVAVKGKQEAVKIYEVVAEQASATDAQKTYVRDFETALVAYYARDWKTAQKLLSPFEDDKTAQLFIERSQHYLTEAPSEEWDGTYVAKDK